MLCFEDIKENVRSFGGCALTFVKDGLEKEDVSYSRVLRTILLNACYFHLDNDSHAWN